MLSEMACSQVVEVPLAKGKFLDVEIVKGEKTDRFYTDFYVLPLLRVFTFNRQDFHSLNLLVEIFHLSGSS